MDHLEQLVAKGVPWQTAGRILLTLLPQALGLTIPMSLLVGLLIGLGRMSGDREAVALLACGVSPYRLLRPVLLLATVAAAATLYVMLEAIPDANQTFREITYDVVTQAGRERHPAAGVLQELSELGPVRPRRPPGRRLEGRPRRGHAAGRTRPSSTWPSGAGWS